MRQDEIVANHVTSTSLSFQRKGFHNFTFYCLVLKGLSKLSLLEIQTCVSGKLKNMRLEKKELFKLLHGKHTFTVKPVFQLCPRIN